MVHELRARVLFVCLEGFELQAPRRLPGGADERRPQRDAQHATPDTHSSPCSWLGENPSGWSGFDDAPRAPAPAGASPAIAGGFRRRASANNGIANKQIRPVPM